MIHNFENFLNERADSGDFSVMIKSAIDKLGLEYDLRSSAQQLKNGTIVIHLKSTSLTDDALEEYNISDDDILDKASFNAVTGLYTGKLDNPSTAKKFRIKTSSDYYFYSRGAVRPSRALSGGDARKFNSLSEEEIESVVQWMINDYKDKYIESILKFLNPDNFGRFRKGYDLDIEQVKQYLPDLTIKVLTQLKEKEPEIFNQISPSILCLCYLAHYREGNVSMDGGDGNYYNFKVSKCKICPAGDRFPGDGETFTMTKDWKQSTKHHTISLALDTKWSVPDSFAWKLSGKSPMEIVSKGDLPSFVEKIMKDLMKKPDYGFEAIDKKYAGSKAGHQYGI